MAENELIHKTLEILHRAGAMRSIALLDNLLSLDLSKNMVFQSVLSMVLQCQI